MAIIFSFVLGFYALLFHDQQAAILSGAWLIYAALAAFNNNFVRFGNNIGTYIEHEINKK